MLTTKLLATVGLLLTLSSIIHLRFWGYERAVVLMQAGGLALALGFFYRIAGRRPFGVADVLAGLYDMESLIRRI